MKKIWPETEKFDLPPGFKWELIRDDIETLCENSRLPDGFSSAAEEIYLPLASWIASRRRARRGKNAIIIGINGAQGSGKSTLCIFIERFLQSIWKMNTLTISIDDLYRTRAEREAMAENIHPLFITRGVPGTHDTELGIRILKNLKNMDGEGKPVLIPVFDKSIDDRAPQSKWKICEKLPEVILFEGWCVGASPEPDENLKTPVNSLEKEKDREMIWRGHVNSELKGSYRELFSLIDWLVMLKVPSISEVLEWRKLQEHKLAESMKNSTDGSRIMSDSEIEEFVMHYQRLTEYMLKEMPSRADILMKLDSSHSICRVSISPTDV